MPTKTLEKKCRSDLESEINRAVIHFEKEIMGRGPLETRTYLFDDIILVRLKGVLTPAEQKLAKSKSSRSSYLLKQVRNELLESNRTLLETVVTEIVKVRVQSVHTDISTKTGERVIVFTLKDKLGVGDCDCSNPPPRRVKSSRDDARMLDDTGEG